MKNWKLLLIVVAVLFVAIVVLQNTEDVVTKILFFEVRTPRAVLLIATCAIGFAVGVGVTLRGRKKKEVKA